MIGRELLLYSMYDSVSLLGHSRYSLKCERYILKDHPKPCMLDISVTHHLPVMQNYALFMF